LVLIGVGCGGAQSGKEETKSRVSIPKRDLGRYNEEAATVPKYPNSVVENYEEAYGVGGKKVVFMRASLSTEDPFKDVKEFYSKAFRERYGEPTEETERQGYYHITKAKSPDALPYFQIEISDMGDFRRVVITRSDKNR